MKLSTFSGNFDEMNILLDDAKKVESAAGKLSKLATKFNELDLLLHDAEKVDASFVMPGEVKLSATEIDLLDQSLAYAFPEQAVVSQQVKNLLNYELQQIDETIAVTEKRIRRERFVSADAMRRVCNKLQILAGTNHEFSQKFLPVHTTDAEWLVHYLQKACYYAQKANNFNKIKAGEVPCALQEIPLVKVKQYMSDSRNFQDKYLGYQCDVITSLVENEIEHFAQLDEFAYHRWTLTYFFSYINKKTNALGINRATTSKAMGKNKQWRDKLLKMTFWGPLDSLSKAEMVTLKTKYPEDYARLSLTVKQAFEIYQKQEEQKEFDHYQRYNLQKDVDALGLHIDEAKRVKDRNHLHPLRIVNAEVEACRNLMRGHELV